MKIIKSKKFNFCYDTALTDIELLCPEIPASFSELSEALNVVQKKDKLASHIMTSVRYSTDQT